MKKSIILLSLLFILFSCGKLESEKIIENKEIIPQVCNSPYEIGKINKSNLKLKGVIVNDDIKTISSSMNGILKKLNCVNGKKVYADTLIASIVPDFNNSNTVNLSIQKTSLINQKINLESIRDTTSMSFDNQIRDVKNQISIIENSIKLTKQSSGISKKDLGKQIKALEDSLLNLKSNLDLTKRAKKDALDKIIISRDALYVKISSIIGDNLLKIDEIFGVTEKNKNLNNKYEVYLSAKDTSLKTSVKNSFLELNNIFRDFDKLSDEDISKLLGDLIDLDNLTKKSIKESIDNVFFNQTQIDAFYTLFLNYYNNLGDLKNGWDSLFNSKLSIITSYDTQISLLQGQIDTSTVNLDNLKTNKLDSVDIGLDLQLSNLDSQLKTLKSNLDNLNTTKKTQILNLDNQIIQLKQSIDSLNVNLTNSLIYSGISGTIVGKLSNEGNNVGLNTPLCNILPNNNSTKIKIYSPVSLNIGDKFSFNFENKEYIISIKNEVYNKDSITQNYIYESNYLKGGNFKGGDILKLTFVNDLKDKGSKEFLIKNDRNITVPVSYVENKINGNFIKTKTSSGILDLEVTIGDINGSFVEVSNGLEGVSTICKQ